MGLIHIQFEERGGLLLVAVQETSTGQLLMLASVNEEALTKTLKTKRATFRSTSRNQFSTKGETYGYFLSIDKILIDCDQDALVYKVTFLGDGICHTYDTEGKHRKACFYREINIEENKFDFIDDME